MKKPNMWFFKRKKPSKEKVAEFWDGFFSKTRKEKHLQELEKYDKAIKDYKIHIHNLGLQIMAIQRGKRFTHKHKWKRITMVRQVIRHWEEQIERMERGKASAIHYWEKGNSYGEVF